MKRAGRVRAVPSPPRPARCGDRALPIFRVTVSVKSAEFRVTNGELQGSSIQQPMVPVRGGTEPWVVMSPQPNAPRSGCHNPPEGERIGRSRMSLSEPNCKIRPDLRDNCTGSRPGFRPSSGRNPRAIECNAVGVRSGSPATDEQCGLATDN